MLGGCWLPATAGEAALRPDLQAYDSRLCRSRGGGRGRGGRGPGRGCGRVVVLIFDVVVALVQQRKPTLLNTSRGSNNTINNDKITI